MCPAGRYFGSKMKLARSSRKNPGLAQIILDYCKEHNLHFNEIIDPFCGTGSMSMEFRKLTDVNIHASDHLKCMIVLLQHLQSGWFPTQTKITEIEFDRLRVLNDDNPMKAIIHILCSYQGHYLKDGYREVKTNENFALFRKRVVGKIPDLQDISFTHCDYKEWSDKKNCLFYLDCPYASCVRPWPINYEGFDHDIFWEWVRAMSQDNICIVSEYNAPSDFECIYTKIVTVCNRYGQKKSQHEKLFIWKGK